MQQGKTTIGRIPWEISYLLSLVIKASHDRNVYLDNTTIRKVNESQMIQHKQTLKNISFILLFILLIIGLSNSSHAASNIFLTEEEQAYIAKKGVIKAVSLDGVAPIQYSDKNKEVQGISKRVLQEISAITGLTFEYTLYGSLREVFESNAEIAFGIPNNYAPPDMILSKPYLRSETILYINAAQDPNNLDNKIYAAVRGSALPKGIKEENSIYFETREQSLDAVEAGRADYGYGNAYSVAFYTLQNGYKNLITIPKGKEARAYCIGFFHEDEILISIINKALSAIGENQLQNLVLDVAAQVERKITFSMVINRYGKEITFIIIAVLSILLFAITSNIKANKTLRMNNRRYEVLSEISNEYLFEYFTKTNHLQLSESFIQQMGTQENLNEANKILKNMLANTTADRQYFEIKLPLGNGEVGIFKVIHLSVNDDDGNLVSIIGKVVNISNEAAKREELANKALLDGLTGLYNAITTKELIQTAICSRQGKQRMDAFILIDLDYFKDINDTHGHLAGDNVLLQLGKVLKQSFRTTDIIGRIGGDEFCIYMPNIPSLDFVKTRCQKVSTLINKEIEDIPVTISVGITLVDQDMGYEEIFKSADEVLYQAKRDGRNQIVAWEER
ncbi:GGDEF domain-containing protein [Sporomusa sphaeroides DSM 2875]|uniref:transporter substrate-binding domain-containing diguanylate cyclase n=1 Tax=Sporomusa sphaeroides TaxID=47679 RepID=UPI00202E31A4|nr:GGDEF domain-containing protein [Sporomusa sphaeroides]MCM0759920.1 GGDEF domain-containing protein [Sporomusa sphaeroides DSM 2875]